MCSGAFFLFVWLCLLIRISWQVGQGALSELSDRPGLGWPVSSRLSVSLTSAGLPAMMNTYLLTTEDTDPRTLPEQAVLYAHLLTRDSMKDECVRKLMASPRFVRSDKGIPYAVLKDMRTHHWTLIRAWREYLEIKRERLAGRMGISVAEYLVIEKGLVPLSLTMLAHLAQGMGLDETQLQMSPYQPVLEPLALS